MITDMHDNAPPDDLFYRLFVTYDDRPSKILAYTESKEDIMALFEVTRFNAISHVTKIIAQHWDDVSGFWITIASSPIQPVETR